MTSEAINYSTYSEAQLFAALSEIQSQKAHLDSREREIRAILHSFGDESSSKDLPTQETIDALNNSYTVLKTHDYAEFEKIIENG